VRATSPWVPPRSKLAAERSEAERKQRRKRRQRHPRSLGRGGGASGGHLWCRSIRSDVCSLSGPRLDEQEPDRSTEDAGRSNRTSWWEWKRSLFGLPPLGDLAISGRSDEYVLRVARCVIEARHYRAATVRPSPRYTKTQIRDWSQKSRRNCVRILAACPLPELWDMITLTCPRIFPRDGRRVRRDLEALLYRL
jgi:hypothetical protein